jgi:hypothetical protein
MDKSAARVHGRGSATFPGRTRRGTAHICVRMVLALCVSLIWGMSAIAGQVAQTGMTVDIVSDPPSEQLVPGASLARVTLNVFWREQPVERGHLTVKLLAPQSAEGFFSEFSSSASGAVLQLETELRHGSFSFQYLFPMSGTYKVEIELAPVPGGEDFSPTTLRKDFPVHGRPAQGRSHWLMLGGLFALGLGAGAVFSHRIKVRRKPSSVAAVVSMLGLCHAVALLSATAVGADHAVNTQIDFPRGPQVIKGDDGWDLVVRPTPVQVGVGEPLQLTTLFRKDGQIFPDATEVSLNVYQLADDKPILRAQVMAPNGSSSQRLRLFDSAPHTCTVTARPAGVDLGSAAGLAAVLGIDVTPQSTSVGVDLRLLTMAVGSLGVGLFAGFLLPRLGGKSVHE